MPPKGSSAKKQIATLTKGMHKCTSTATVYRIEFEHIKGEKA